MSEALPGPDLITRSSIVFDAEVLPRNIPAGGKMLSRVAFVERGRLLVGNSFALPR